MSLSSVATRGYQPSGSVQLVATFGYGQGATPPPPPQVVTQQPYGPARGWPLVRRRRDCDRELDALCKEEVKLEKQIEKPTRTELQARKAEEKRASLALVKERIAALESRRDAEDLDDLILLDDLMLIDELDDLED